MRSARCGCWTGPVGPDGYAVVTWGFVSLDLLTPLRWSNILFALVLLGGIVVVASPRLTAREAYAESG